MKNQEDTGRTRSSRRLRLKSRLYVSGEEGTEFIEERNNRKLQIIVKTGHPPGPR